MTHLRTAALICALLAGCQSVPYSARTPSGRPEAIFLMTTPAEVLAKISTLCLERRMIIQNHTDRQIECFREDNTLLARLLVGNNYSTTPIFTVRFNAIQFGDNVRVQAYQTVASQLAFGQTRVEELNDADDFNRVQQALIQIGGRLP